MINKETKLILISFDVTAARLALAQGISLSVNSGPGAPGTETETTTETKVTPKVNGDTSAPADDKQTSMDVDNDDSKVSLYFFF